MNGAMNGDRPGLDGDRAGRLMRRATHAAVATALLLVAVKLGAWLMTGSVAILSALVDSLLDTMASLVNLFAVRQALVPADREHRFGHGKAEPLAGLAQSAFITGSGILLMIEAVTRFLEPRPIANGAVGLGVMAFSLVATLLLVSYQKRVVAATGSLAVGADKLHYTGDILLNGAAMLAILAGWLLGWHYADPLFAVAIGGFLMFNAWGIGQSSLQILMDRELPDAERDQIKAICAAHPGVRAVHDLRTRWDGSRRFIQLHLEMDPTITLKRAHMISVEVENQILAAFPNAQIIIHEDPADAEPPALSASA
jgi:ferrous-iron efflux pump FieF